jgi:hypothetical protein
LSAPIAGDAVAYGIETAELVNARAKFGQCTGVKVGHWD